MARRKERLDSLAAEIAMVGGTALAVEADITDRDQAAAALRQLVDRLGGYMVTRPRHAAIGELWIMPTEQL